MPKILVTGSGGVLGHAFRAVAPEYPEHEFEFIRSADVNLTDGGQIIPAIFARHPDVIIHLAALSGGVGLSAKHPVYLIQANVKMAMNVLEAAKVIGVSKTIMTLSGGMYPADAAQPLREDSIHDGPPHESNYAYAHAKRLIEPLIRAYREQYGMSVIGLVPDAMYGPGDYFGLEDSNMTAALVAKFHAAKESGNGVTLWGWPNPQRQLTYAPDVAYAYLWCLKHYDSPEIINIAAPEEVHRVHQVATAIQEILDMDVEVQWDTDKPYGPRLKQLDTSRFMSLCPDFSWTTLRDGLRATIEWYKRTMETNPAEIRTGPKVRE